MNKTPMFASGIVTAFVALMSCGGSSDGGGDAVTACKTVCQRSREAKCASDALDRCEQRCDEHGGFPACTAKFDALVACATASPIACNAQGSSVASNCAQETSVFASCAFSGGGAAGVGGGGSGGGGSGGSAGNGGAGGGGGAPASGLTANTIEEWAQNFVPISCEAMKTLCSSTPEPENNKRAVGLYECLWVRGFNNGIGHLSDFERKAHLAMCSPFMEPGCMTLVGKTFGTSNPTNQMFMKKFWSLSNPKPTNPAALIATCDASIQWSLSQP